MRDKFKANIKIALPAALITLTIILILSLNTIPDTTMNMEYNLTQIIPYILVLIGGVIGINVFVVLLIGIFSSALIMILTNSTSLIGLLSMMKSGAEGMYETIMIAVLVSAICALIDEYGGFTALLNFIKRVFKSKKTGKLGIGLLVGTMDIATANNTVAIVMANPIAKEIREEYGITPQNTASLLDTFSCIFQGIIPYGAQMLVAVSAAHEMGVQISAFDLMGNLFYPYILFVSCLIFIFVIPEK